MSRRPEIESLAQLDSRPIQSTLTEWTSFTDVNDRLFNVPGRQRAVIGGLVQSSSSSSSPPPLSPKSAVSSVIALLSSSSAQSTNTTEAASGSVPSHGWKGAQSLPSLCTSSTITSSLSDPVEPTPIQGVKQLSPDGQEISDDTIQSPLYECSFWFLKCTFRSRDVEEWRTHCGSHFKGKPPPTTVECPLCARKFSDSKCAWDAKMEHLAEHHREGLTLATGRPDFALFKYLWAQRIISDPDYLELLGSYTLRERPRHFVLTNHPGRDRRGGPPPQWMVG